MAATTATTHAARDTATRTNPRQKANTVDKPTTPITIRSNAVTWTRTSFCRRDDAVVARGLELRKRRVGGITRWIRPDAHALHRSLRSRKRLGVARKAGQLEFGGEIACRFGVGE